MKEISRKKTHYLISAFLYQNGQTMNTLATGSHKGLPDFLSKSKHKLFLQKGISVQNQSAFLAFL
jgi:hypothetical protein